MLVVGEGGGTDEFPKREITVLWAYTTHAVGGVGGELLVDSHLVTVNNLGWVLNVKDQELRAAFHI